jgi:hypothetical protein
VAGGSGPVFAFGHAISSFSWKVWPGAPEETEGASGKGNHPMGILGWGSRKESEAMEEGKKGTPVQIEIDPKEAEGIYSNLVLLSHSPSEFILDFARVLPGTRKAKVYSRIIMTPQNALSLLKALQANIERFESQFGKIRRADGASKTDIGFK